MRYKCPFCGSQEFTVEQSFKAHAHWKHGKSLSGDLRRFEAPTYGIGSSSEIYERHAYEERRRDSWSDVAGDVASFAVGALIGSMFDDSSSSFSSSDSWSGGGGDSGGGGASGDW